MARANSRRSALAHAAGYRSDDSDSTYSSLLFATRAGEAFAKIGFPEKAESLYAVACADAAALFSAGAYGVRELELAVSLFCLRARGASALTQHALATAMLAKAEEASHCEGVAPADALPLLERLSTTYLDIGA
jgi:TPR repeat protein